MNIQFAYSILLVILFIVVSVFVVFFLCKWYLKRIKVISYPIAGMDWDKVVYASCIFLGSFIILLSIVEPTFQSYKVYTSQEHTSSLLFYNFSLQYSELFLVILLSIIFYFAFVKSFQILLRYKSKGNEDLDDNNFPFSLIIASVSIGMAVIIKVIVYEVLLTIIPFTVNYSFLYDLKVLNRLLLK